MNEQFAGYILSGVNKVVRNSPDAKFWLKVCENLSAFTYRNSILANDANEVEDPIFTVLDNQISRGLPTLPSINIEQEFASKLNLTIPAINDRKELEFDLIGPTADYLRCLVIAESRPVPMNGELNYQTWEEHGGSEYEQVFFEKVIEKFGLGTNQLLQLQRSISSVIEKNVTEDSFSKESVDFVIQFPQVDEIKGLVIEIDGKQHEDEPQKSKDQRRAHFASLNGFNTVRIKTGEVRSMPETAQVQIESYLKHPYSASFSHNMKSPLFGDEVSLDYLQAFLSPFGIARIQKTIVKAIKTNLLDLKKPSWNIAIIERDVPCGSIALEDLFIQIKHLSILQKGKAKKMPKIKVSIFNTQEYASCKLNKGAKAQLFNESIDFTQFDLTIDIAVLCTNGFYNYPSIMSPNQTVIIRSVLHTETKRRFSFYPAIEYKNSPSSLTDDSIESLNFFLQSFFRKESFREGQVEIINLALKLKNPIALLPTGGGKSITYQIPALLQPGLTIVVDPIKALMRDQDENLRLSSIDATVYINSSLSARQKEENVKAFIRGESIFAFVSPERFVIDKFRSAIQTVASANRYFSYCVIDEAHCVSEWGHDFRTAYLKLGDNSRSFCPSGNEKRTVTTIGLTGTASPAVLSDVVREIDLKHDADIVRPKSHQRKELHFKIVEVDASMEGFGRLNDWNIRQAVFSATRDALIKTLSVDLLSDFNSISFPDFIKQRGGESNCGLIFCSHARNTPISVEEISTLLKTKFPSIAHLIGEFYGASEGNEDVQDDFKSNRKTLLIATKAYGMGIDKRNIRFTIHMTHPISIEGFYQEAGRAGRDGKDSSCYILHCENLKLLNRKNVGRVVQEGFLFNSFKGAQYEKNVLFDLLERNTFPYTPVRSILENEIFEELSHEIRFGQPFPRDNPHSIYINGQQRGQDFGLIRIPDLSYSIEKRNMLGVEAAKELLQCIVDKIKEQKPKEDDIAKWLNSHMRIERNLLPGVKEHLESLEIGQSKTLTISLENDGIQRLLEYLQPSFNEVDYSLIKKATDFCRNEEEFLENLRTRYRRLVGREIAFDYNQESEIKRFFGIIRQSVDTLKAIYRLSIIGVIEDYTIEYPDQTTAYCKRIKDEEIIEKLEQYVSRYVTRVSASSVREKIKASKEGTVLRRSIDYLVDFIYSQVFEKRRNALLQMEVAVSAGLREPSKFIEEVNNYFDSQYLDPLNEATVDGREFNFEILFRFMDEVGDDKDKLQQLRSSAGRLSEAFPDNPVFSWLSFYCSLLLRDREDEQLVEYFSNGYRDFYASGKGFSKLQIDNAIDEMRLRVKGHDQDSYDKHMQAEAVFASRLKLTEFKAINDKFLMGYDERT